MYHISPVPIKKLQNTPIKRLSASWKPTGFWYAKGKSWLDFVKHEMDDDRGCCYFYKVNIDPKLRILKVNSLKDYLKFAEKYPAYQKFISGRSDEYYQKNLPNWKELSKEYDGFEIIIPYFQKLKSKYFGLKMFDVPSGCLWRVGDTKLTLVRKYDFYPSHHLLELNGNNFGLSLDKLVNSNEYKNEIGEWNKMQGIDSRNAQYLENSRIAFMYDSAVKGLPLIGTAKICVLPKKGFAELINVFIFKKYRGKGLCSQLVTKTVNKYKEEFPDTKILVLVAKENISATKCYLKAGFKKFSAPWLIKRLSKKYSFEVMAI